MREGSLVLARLPQADGFAKIRPVLLLRELPSYGDFLVCGVSSQLHKSNKDLDEIITANDGDFVSSGLRADSVIRLTYLSVLPRNRIVGSIGAIEPKRWNRLLWRLSRFLTANVDEP